MKDKGPIYVVVGSTGEYSDYQEWNVCWRLSRPAAETLAAELQAEANKHAALNDSCYGENEAQREYRKAMKDQRFQRDYTGTRYRVDVVPW